MGENLRYTAPRFIGTEGIQFTVARDDGALGLYAEPADDYDVMMAEREALKAAQEHAAQQAGEVSSTTVSTTDQDGSRSAFLEALANNQTWNHDSRSRKLGRRASRGLRRMR